MFYITESLPSDFSASSAEPITPQSQVLLKLQACEVVTHSQLHTILCLVAKQCTDKSSVAHITDMKRMVGGTNTKKVHYLSVRTYQWLWSSLSERVDPLDHRVTSGLLVSIAISSSLCSHTASYLEWKIWQETVDRSKSKGEIRNWNTGLEVSGGKKNSHMLCCVFPSTLSAHMCCLNIKNPSQVLIKFLSIKANDIVSL